jgi:hypothetical protein
MENIYGKFFFIIIIDIGVYWVYLIIVVTCVFLLDKLGYFVGTGVFALLLPMGACYLAGLFYFAILWLVPWFLPSLFVYKLLGHDDDNMQCSGKNL